MLSVLSLLHSLIAFGCEQQEDCHYIFSVWNLPDEDEEDEGNEGYEVDAELN